MMRHTPFRQLSIGFYHGNAVLQNIGGKHIMRFRTKTKRAIALTAAAVLTATAILPHTYLTPHAAKCKYGNESQHKWTGLKPDTKALSGDFFLFSADGAALLGFYTDSQNPSIFPQPYQIPIKKRYPQNSSSFFPHLVFFFIVPPHPSSILAL
jgi:hypothetical protein